MTKKIQVSASLLEKYHRDLCSAQEKEAVEQWLCVGEDVFSTAHDPKEEAEIEKKMWSMISAAQRDRERATARRAGRLYYGVAAGLILFVAVGIAALSGFFQNHKVNTFTMSNKQGKAPLVRQVGDLRIALLPGSEAKWIYDNEQKTGKLTFSNTILVMNVSDDAEMLQLKIDQADSILQDGLCCLVGKPYLATWTTDEKGNKKVHLTDVLELPASMSFETMAALYTQLETVKGRTESKKQII